MTTTAASVSSADVKALLSITNTNYADVRQQLDDLRTRLRAAIADVVDESGLGSPQHLRLRYALTGEGEGAPSAKALAAVAAQNSGSN